MKKILIVSDTHQDIENLQRIIKEESPDYVIHAGDHCLNSVEELIKYVDYYIAGNNDYIGKEYDVFKIENIKILLIHGHQFQLSEYEKWEKEIYDFSTKYNVDLIIYGHSHVERVNKINNCLIINPGSLKYPRNNFGKKSYVIININKDEIKENSFEQIVRYL